MCSIVATGGWSTTSVNTRQNDLLGNERLIAQLISNTHQTDSRWDGWVGGVYIPAGLMFLFSHVFIWLVEVFMWISTDPTWYSHAAPGVEVYNYDTKISHCGNLIGTHFSLKVTQDTFYTLWVRLSSRRLMKCGLYSKRGVADGSLANGERCGKLLNYILFSES